jgi:NitT/TauT family transport system substrate-binding protein
MLRSACSIAIALSVLAVGCKKPPPLPESQRAMTPVRVQLNWVAEPEFAGLYAARDEGFFQKGKLSVDIAGGGAGTPVVQLVATGKADFGVVGADDVVIARARGVDVVALFATFQHSPQGVMVHASRGLTDLADVKDGTIALEPGLPFGSFVKKKYGFAGATILPYDGGISKFVLEKTHAQQCYVTSEPIAARAAGADVQIFDAQKIGFDPYAAVIITRGETLRTKPELVKTFIGAVAQGWRVYLTAPHATNETIHGLNLSIELRTLDQMAEAERPLIDAHDTPASPLGAMTAARWQVLAAQLHDLGIITTEPVATDCFSTIALPQ